MKNQYHYRFYISRFARFIIILGFSNKFKVKKTDLTYLYSMTGDDPKLINEMIELFIDQVKETGDELDEAYKGKNYDRVGKLAHKAKSSVQIMGMNDLSKKLAELEFLANEARNINEYPSYIEYFNEECRQAIEELIDHKHKLSL